MTSIRLAWRSFIRRDSLSTSVLDLLLLVQFLYVAWLWYNQGAWAEEWKGWWLGLLTAVVGFIVMAEDAPPTPDNNSDSPHNDSNAANKESNDAE